jgi:hypothetical protein
MKNQKSPPSGALMSAACLVAVLLSPALAVAKDKDVAAIAGPYSIWEDFEGGRVCPITLDAGRTIGGYVLEGDNDCMVPFKLPDDPYAWFVDKDGKLTFIDVTRHILLQFERLADGSFYARREQFGLENLNLTPE